MNESYAKRVNDSDDVNDDRVGAAVTVGDRGYDQDNGNATVRGEAFITFSFDITYIIMLTICMHTA